MPVCGSRHDHGFSMKTNLPPRPNLDHLRRQAKELLSAFERREADTVSTIRQHLPAAKNLTAAQAAEMPLRLADAQSVIARKTGFAGWPHLSRHVEQLRALEGTWNFTYLEIDGSVIPSNALTASRLMIDGDRFRSESPEANYEGIFNINVEADPHEIDIEFIEGPEAGNWNYGIFCFEGDELKLCLDLNGKPRPEKFGTSLGSGRAYETLKRTSNSRPKNVVGGTPALPQSSAPVQIQAGFEFAGCQTLMRLEGEWTAVRVIRDGKELPEMMVRTGLRKAAQNRITIMFGGQIMTEALVKIDESANPVHVDYCNTGGMCPAGTVQLGLLKWIGGEVCFCTGAPGSPRPVDFNCPAGSGQTFSQWRRRQ